MKKYMAIFFGYTCPNKQKNPRTCVFKNSLHFSSIDSFSSDFVKRTACNINNCSFKLKLKESSLHIRIHFTGAGLCYKSLTCNKIQKIHI